MEEKEMNFEEIAESTADKLYEEQPSQEAAPQQEDVPPQEEQIPDENTQPDAAQETNDEALRTAVDAANMAVQKQGEVNQLAAQLESERAKNEQLSAELARQNAENEQKLVQKMTKDAPIAPPTLNIDPYDDEDTIKNKTQRYNEEYDAYVRARMSDEFAPMLEFSKKAMAERNKADAVAAVKKVPEFADYDNYSDKIDRMLSGSKLLNRDAPLDQQIALSYLAARGLEAVTAKAPSAAEVFEKYKDDPEFIELFNKSQIEKLKGTKDIPAFSSSGGISNAAPNVKDEPKNWDEVFERTKNKF